ncbi:hypothetical protein [Levilactobacillus cerevisiae]|uniref:hypothetical protein n=1 Tax=Levilactobacillus cerevisiae TaxID=1704076 RepID=UPI000F79C2EF|nr:hypothetical protein [Levilactobacillus cerevisiae]
MWRKLKILSRFELRQTWDDKGILFYTLICPSIYFVIVTFSSGGHPFGLHNLAYQLLGYWAYIILVGVLNGFQFGLIGMRENNFLKMFTIIAGDKRLIFYSNLLVQVVFVQIEVVLFDLIVLILNPASLSLVPMMVGGFLLNFILIPIVAGFSNFILLLPLKMNVMSLLMMGYIFLGMLLINLPYQQNSLLNIVLTILSPFSYLINFYVNALRVISQPTLLNVALLGIVALVYLTVGYYPVRHMKLQSYTSRY